MKQMLEAGAHFGHQTKRWNPKMKPYIFGARNGIYIIDLQKSVELFKRAQQAVVRAAADGGKVLFVGTKKQAVEIIAEEANRCGGWHVNSRWLGGTMTNFVTVKKSIERYKSLLEMRDKNSWGPVTKKEQLLLQKELVKMEKTLGGVREMDQLPAMLFVIDPRKEHIAIHEANKLGIPVVAMCDTNCDPEPIDYVIPSNDDAIRAIKLFTGAVADAVLEGRTVFEENLRQRRTREKEEAAQRARSAAPAPKAAPEGDQKPEAAPPAGVAIEVKRGRKRAADRAVDHGLDDDDAGAEDLATEKTDE
jgi:small subunit ribosomal protein S2